MPRPREASTTQRLEDDGPEADPFMKEVQAAISTSLKFPEPKDLNAAIGNAIKFLAIRAKLTGGDDEEFWGRD